jgi:molecular chaperone DnaJ
MRLSGKGDTGYRGGSNGDLYVLINVQKHKIFQRSEENLYYKLPISMTDAALGAEIEVPTIDGGKSKVKIPEGTQSGKQFRLKGKGMPILRENDFGDLYLETNVIIPETLSKEQRELLLKFKSLEDPDNNSEIKNFFNKAKKFYKDFS